MANVDDEYKDKGRPTSMMAQRFSMLLDSSFGLDETTESVIKKKEEVASRAAELEELEARLAAMEERLSTNKKTDNLAPNGKESPHSRSRSVSQKPYLRGPIALSVRPETPKSEKLSEVAAGKQPARAAPQQPPPQMPSRKFMSMRRRRPQPEEEEEDSEEEDSDESEEEVDDSQTSSSEEPTRRK